MRRVGILVAAHKANIEGALRRLIKGLEGCGMEVRLTKEAAALLGRPTFASPGELTDVDLLIALGGDGCVLSAARLASPKGIPVLGVRLGGFGFLTEAETENLEKALERVKKGEFQLEEHPMLQAQLQRDERPIWSAIGLNDVIIIKTPASPLPQWDVWVGQEELARYPADGVLVSTPTGSTAYALAAGGPILAPDVRALLLMPMFAHTLSIRPLVLPSKVAIRVRLLPQRRPVSGEVSVDGQVNHPLRPKDWVVVKFSPYRVKIIRFDGSSFFERLRRKLQWGERR